jgi:MerR family transcriptional regulator, light-induced transcriptional regulator
MHDFAGSVICEQKRSLAEEVKSSQVGEHPEFTRQNDSEGMRFLLQGAEHYFAALAETVRFDCPALFLDYVSWSNIVLTSRNIPVRYLVRQLEAMKQVIRERLPVEARELAEPQIQAAIEQLPGMPVVTTSFLMPDNPKIELAKQWLDALLQRDAAGARRVIFAAVSDGVSLMELQSLVLAPSLQEVGRLWQIHRIDEALEHFCSRTTYNVLAVLSTYTNSVRRWKLAVGLCVASEEHELGLLLALDALQLEGWDTVFLGADVPTQNILRSWNPDVFVISATMPYHLHEAKKLTDAVQKNSTGRLPPKIIVGGRPFNVCPDLWRKVGADGRGENFTEFVRLANSL